MIRIAFKSDRENHLIGFSCQGHAGSGDYGKDIVCAATSVLVINTINSIERFTDSEFECSEDEETGSIFFELKSLPNAETELLLRSLELGLKDIQQSYGKKFISFFEEV